MAILGSREQLCLDKTVQNATSMNLKVMTVSSLYAWFFNFLLSLIFRITFAVLKLKREVAIFTMIWKVLKDYLTVLYPDFFCMHNYIFR